MLCGVVERGVLLCDVVWWCVVVRYVFVILFCSLLFLVCLAQARVEPWFVTEFVMTMVMAARITAGPCGHGNHEDDEALM